jgi:hypothetical protein
MSPIRRAIKKVLGVFGIGKKQPIWSAVNVFSGPAVLTRDKDGREVWTPGVIEYDPVGHPRIINPMGSERVTFWRTDEQRHPRTLRDVVDVLREQIDEETCCRHLDMAEAEIVYGKRDACLAVFEAIARIEKEPKAKAWKGKMRFERTTEPFTDAARSSA